MDGGDIEQKIRSVENVISALTDYVEKHRNAEGQELREKAVEMLHQLMDYRMALREESRKLNPYAHFDKRLQEDEE